MENEKNKDASSEMDEKKVDDIFEIKTAWSIDDVTVPFDWSFPCSEMQMIAEEARKVVSLIEEDKKKKTYDLFPKKPTNDNSSNIPEFKPLFKSVINFSTSEIDSNEIFTFHGASKSTASACGPPNISKKKLSIPVATLRYKFAKTKSIEHENLVSGIKNLRIENGVNGFASEESTDLPNPKRRLVHDDDKSNTTSGIFSGEKSLHEPCDPKRKPRNTVEVAQERVMLEDQSSHGHPQDISAVISSRLKSPVSLLRKYQIAKRPALQSIKNKMPETVERNDSLKDSKLLFQKINLNETFQVSCKVDPENYSTASTNRPNSVVQSSLISKLVAPQFNYRSNIQKECQNSGIPSHIAVKCSQMQPRTMISSLSHVGFQKSSTKTNKIT